MNENNNYSNQSSAGSTPPTLTQVTPDITTAEKHGGITVTKFLVAALVVLIVIGGMIPGAAWIGWPVFGFGLLCSLSFIAKTFRQSRRYGVTLQVFVCLGGIGVGIVILIISLVAALSAVAFKDPTAFNFGLIKI